jgi:hypothetical protein
MDRTPCEVDIVAESTDGTAVLIGEAAWTEDPDRTRLEAEARRKAENLPFVHGRQLMVGVWSPATASRGGHFGPRVVLQTLQ